MLFSSFSELTNYWVSLVPGLELRVHKEPLPPETVNGSDEFNSPGVGVTGQNNAQELREPYKNDSDHRCYALVLDLIRVPVNDRRKGVATSIIKDLINLASTEQLKSIQVTATPELGTPESILHVFYTGLGFIPTHQQDNDYVFNIT